MFAPNNLYLSPSTLNAVVFKSMSGLDKACRMKKNPMEHANMTETTRGATSRRTQFLRNCANRDKPGRVGAASIVYKSKSKGERPSITEKTTDKSPQCKSRVFNEEKHAWTLRLDLNRWENTSRDVLDRIHAAIQPCLDVPTLVTRHALLTCFSHDASCLHPPPPPSSLHTISCEKDRGSIAIHHVLFFISAHHGFSSRLFPPTLATHRNHAHPHHHRRRYVWRRLVSPSFSARTARHLGSQK